MLLWTGCRSPQGLRGSARDCRRFVKGALSAVGVTVVAGDDAQCGLGPGVRFAVVPWDCLSGRDPHRIFPVAP